MKFPELIPEEGRMVESGVRCPWPDCTWEGETDDVVYENRGFGSIPTDDILPVPVCPRCGKDLC